jgi:hypothetical protein
MDRVLHHRSVDWSRAYIIISGVGGCTYLHDVHIMRCAGSKADVLKERELQGDRLSSLRTTNALHIFPFVEDTFQARMRLYGGREIKDVVLRSPEAV